MERSLRKALRFKAFRKHGLTGHIRVLMGHFVFPLCPLQFIHDISPFIGDKIEAKFYTLVGVNCHVVQQIFVERFTGGLAFYD